MEKNVLLLLTAALASAAFSGAPPALRPGEPAVMQDSVLWLDAGDFRGASPDVCLEMDDGWRSRCSCTTSEAVVDGTRPPILRKDKDGLPYVDFGKFSSGRDLSLVPRRTDVRTAFVVAKLDSDRHCHFLCDSKGYDFHRTERRVRLARMVPEDRAHLERHQ